MIFKKKIKNVEYLDENYDPAYLFEDYPEVKRWKLNLMDLIRMLNVIISHHLFYVIFIEKAN